MNENGNSSELKKDYWKSLADYDNDPGILMIKENEFLEGVTDDFDEAKLTGISRRRFIALLTASTAFAATACTDYREKGEIIPYNKRPEEIKPGIANYYASTCSGCSQSCGILVKTREGRPIKIDGNPEHPVNNGKICSKGQASILNLYDPERLKEPLISGRKSGWEIVDKEIISLLDNASKKNREIAIVTGKIVSPTVVKLLNDFKIKYPSTKIYSVTLVDDKIRSEAWFESYGTYNYPAIKFDEANIILSIDSDFLGNEGNFIENMQKYSIKREVVDKVNFNRLYVAEGRLSATGMMADYRISIDPDKQYQFVMLLAKEILKSGSAISLSSEVISRINNSKTDLKIDRRKLSYLLKDLLENKGKSIIYAGDTLSKDVHAAVNLLNEILGNTALYDFSRSFKSFIPYSKTEELMSLIDSMNNNKVDVVIHFDVNPLFILPDYFGYGSSLKKVAGTIALTESENETSSACKYVLPINNQLESWGDANLRAGIYNLQQPVIAPIFNTRQKESVLLTWLSGTASSYKEDLYHKFLISSFNDQIYSRIKNVSDQKTIWYSALHDGFVIFNEEMKRSDINQKAFLLSKELGENKSYTLHLTESYFIGDGRFANNGWLQEVPHPVSKVAWDNYASISPTLAKELNLEMNDVIEINAGEKSLNLPVIVQPGVAEKTINVELGYGRTVIGDVGNKVGFNPIVLITKYYDSSPFIITNISIKKTGEKYNLVSTQEHHSLDDTFVKDFHKIRNIIQEGTIQEYISDPYFLRNEKKEIFGITREHKYTGVKWAMSIDLNKCTSCTACVTSCNVENNIPVVGKDQVERGREMQWMRIDRYYSGSPDEPIVSNQPMLCQHCDNAPCENVCPVNATNHSPDGLNQMAYNRCVGTRYCSNNCPYKVRRYNFFDFRDHFADEYYQNNLTSLVNNPEVTVRSRGVMEKCTFCIQRIMEARSNAITEGRELKGTDVVTACQQACPTNAIVFGDMNDPDSKISKMREHNLAYHVLEELNVKPNVTYIAKLRNTQPEDN
ncbi:MAG: TAT-variant-translocated molybdopterin oxidoreductase [Bacteroidota bacterium]